MNIINNIKEKNHYIIFLKGISKSINRENKKIDSIFICDMTVIRKYLVICVMLLIVKLCLPLKSDVYGVYRNPQQIYYCYMF